MKPVRRQDRETSIAEARELLAACEYGILSTAGEDGWPYGVPLSYVFRDDAIYFHCAVDGHKLENLAANPRVSFCVVGKTCLLPDRFATEYESAVAFGQAHEIYGEERHLALCWLLEKYCAGFVPQGRRYIDEKEAMTRVIKVEVQHITGKARR